MRILSCLTYVTLVSCASLYAGGSAPADEPVDIEELSKRVFRNRPPAKQTVINFCTVKRFGSQGLPLLARCPNVSTVVLFPREMQMAVKDLDALETLPKLKKLSLHGIEPFGDTGLARIAELKQIRSLYIRGGGYTETGLMKLGTLPDLSSVTLRHSEMDPAGVLRFGLTHPDVRVIASFGDRHAHWNFNTTIPELLGRQKPPVVTNELNDTMKKRFSRVDTNHDQWISHGEYVSAGQRPPRAVRAAFFRTIIVHGDRMQFWDYVIMRQEIDEARNSFARIDVDEDGVITETEVRATLSDRDRDLASHVFQTLSPKLRPLSLHDYMTGWARTLSSHREDIAAARN